MTLDVRFEDNHLIAAVKSVGVPSQADDSGAPDMLSMVKAYIAERYNKPGAVYVGLVHRLDRPVGGLMLFARTSKAASRLSEQIRLGQWHKTYLAVTEGVPPCPAGELRDMLLKNARTNMVRIVPKGTAGAKEASLRYDMIGQDHGRSLVAVTLYTGRSHQIRVQLANIGCPLVGDHKYGTGHGASSPALWSWRLSLEHPVRREPLTIEAPLPEGEPWDAFFKEGALLPG